ncbi:hypothetical protein B296_00005763 [Ensete ventricosum]|uniref:Uncharacterized protein n=1 Tax=Ensete ventricosum TaxID=4639 RepID=A0A426ZHM5_ENSVE|nr:hypothetical protein B296_00005763 [Ensete ventricosum]
MSPLDLRPPLLIRLEPSYTLRAGFYSNDCGEFVHEALILFIAYHTVAPDHVVQGHCDEAHAVLPATGGCRPCPPYPCQVGRTTADPSMLMSDRLQHIGLATSAGLLSEGAGTWQPGQHPSYHSPAPSQKTFSRFLIRVPKMRSYNEPSDGSEVRLVSDPNEHEHKSWGFGREDELGTNLGDLAERVTSGTNPWDLAERVNSGTNPGDLDERMDSGTNPEDLTERVNLGTNPGDLVERVNSGTNPRDLAQRVNSGTNLGDLAEKVNSGTNPGNLAKKVNSGTNPRDLVERVNSGINLRDLAERGLVFSIRVISSLGSGGVSLFDPEASPSGASSGPPSLVNVRALRDLEVMKADHDLDTTVTKGSLVVIRERYSIPTEYGLHVPPPG